MVLGAVMLNTLIAEGTKALFSIAPTFQPLQPEDFIPATVLGVVGALIVFALLARWTPQPSRLFQRIVVVALPVSLLPALLLPFIRLFPGTTFPGVGALVLMHTATALICLGTLSRVNS